MECFINKIKHYRRIFSRFEKLDTRYLGFLHFTAALIWLREMSAIITQCGFHRGFGLGLKEG